MVRQDFFELRMCTLFIGLDSEFDLGVVTQICRYAESSSRFSKWALLIVNHRASVKLLGALLAVYHIFERFRLEIL